MVAILWEMWPPGAQIGARSSTASDGNLGRVIRVEKSGSNSTVVWNPWTTQKLPDDFDPAEHKHMVCVESGNVKQNKILLAPGKTSALKVILMSGYSAGLAGTDIKSSRADYFLAKPFAIQELATAVRQCLDGQLGPGQVPS